MNGFEKHSIKHLSASSINLWTNAPDVWVAQYLFGMRSPISAAAMRGICTEDAVVAVLTGKDKPEAALKAALKKFDNTFPIGSEKTRGAAKDQHNSQSRRLRNTCYRLPRLSLSRSWNNHRP